MKNQSDILRTICHVAIHTRAVFFDNNQVYLKKNIDAGSQATAECDEWFPVNFQWIPVLHLNKNLIHQSNRSSK